MLYLYLHLHLELLNEEVNIYLFPPKELIDI